MRNLEESTKIATEAKFATLARALADAIECGDTSAQDAAVDEMTLRRAQEQASSKTTNQFAALARQIGDAKGAGKDTGELTAQVVRLRRRECSGQA